MNKNPEVERFLKARNHLMDKEIQLVRDIILENDDGVTETVK